MTDLLTARLNEASEQCYSDPGPTDRQLYCAQSAVNGYLVAIPSCQCSYKYTSLTSCCTTRARIILALLAVNGYYPSYR